MSTSSHELDHIDPVWKEGREYQLVCGSDLPCNIVRRTNSENARKNNRFLPWRVSYTDLGGIPVNPGDLCQFLDPETEEWVLEEFLGEWWFSKTRNNFSSSVVGKNNVLSGHLKHIEGVGGRACFEKNLGIFKRDPETHSRDSSKGGKIGGKVGGKNGGKKSRTTKENYSKAGKVGGVKAMATLYYDPKNPELGIRSAPTLVRMQKARGLPNEESNRVKVTNDN